MTTQPEALRLAEAAPYLEGGERGQWIISAATELRRLHHNSLVLTNAQREWVGLTDEDWEKVANRKNTVLDTFEQGATWAAYKLERRNT